MRPPPELTPEEQEWQLLAEAYALGELDEGGMQRLYDLLRDSEHGATVATMTWDSLQLRGILRSALDPHFRDLIVDRIDESENRREEDRGFLGNLLAGIGLARPRLSTVRIELPQRHRRIWPLLTALTALLVLAGTLLVLFGDQRQPVLVESVSGRASRAGQAVVAEQRVGSAIVQVARGSDIVIAWDDGQRARIAGPAAFSANRQGLSLSEGRARIVAGPSDLIVGLPDQRLELDAAGEVMVVGGRDEQPRIGLLAGSARCRCGDGAVVHLDPGSWSDGSRRHGWLRAEPWHERIPAPGGDWWTCTVELSFEETDDRAIFLLDDRPLLECRGDRLITSEGQELILQRAPRQRRRIALRRRGDSLRVNLDERDTPLRIVPAVPCPNLLQLSGGTRVHTATISSGPLLIPPP